MCVWARRCSVLVRGTNREIAIMDEQELQEKPGLFTRMIGWTRRETVEEEASEEFDSVSGRVGALRPSYDTHVTVRKDIQSLDEAYAAGAGIKRGELQVLNLADTEPNLRRQIKDFLNGVCFAHDGTWIEIGEDVWLLTPPTVYVEDAAGRSVGALNRHN